VTALSIPVLFALAGVGLIALAAFGAHRVELDPPVSFAPPVVPRPPARWARPRGWYPPAAAPARPTPSASAPPQPNWPARIAPEATRCDAVTRMAIVDALARLETPWAEANLRGVLTEETDPAIRESALRALAALRLVQSA
jgi:hypothetical protein